MYHAVDANMIKVFAFHTGAMRLPEGGGMNPRKTLAHQERTPGEPSMPTESLPLTPADLAPVTAGALITSTFRAQLPGDRRALYLSRVWTRRIVTVLGWRGDVLRAVEAVARLVDNGVRHGLPDSLLPCELRLSLSAAIEASGCLVIDVSDLNPAFPDFDAAVRGERGRGLWQVARLGARVTRFLPEEGAGKTVRAILAPGLVDL
ncbi:hypothetical protein [Streptomyces sp. Tu 3180]|uniref:ATP-binding protein n=1 Tax=Streptomyces sp. Tu 3180 TaxID=2682611 RepID=UPI00135AF65B|nr:hypothetical protein [Streptomyces sp. Tu 3180]KAF3470103.1 ATP-binding protein [Streptomyces sp. Tu 3180]